ncbi:hypothetical protein [Bradyrhizobium stylosanthis]|uniref:Transmembrane protein n=1 Tax=Bradyrhizobium stylosanthis TaxID=1803665 RepID=A0A560DQ44_9BRAD|nr:hypothetical protein [Bradyrhizobium stylosanthis]TWA99152.1 hypothetical protein FBZ96_104120 [Bradyrhizobium stylosanthis]
MDIKPIAIGAAAFATAFIGAASFFVLSNNSAKCDSIDAISNVKELAQKRLAWPTDVDYLLRTGGSAADRDVIRKKVSDRMPLEFDIELTDGATNGGADCAATLYVMQNGRRTFQLASEYSVKRSMGGRTAVTASFQPR